tara:strand:+ start:209 stop:358 length:150 start_codon:yes stop_codon:yes gene_type:complete
MFIDNNTFIGDLVPTVWTYQKAIDRYKKGIKEGAFYEEPIGEDFIYPDW